MQQDVYLDLRSSFRSKRPAFKTGSVYQCAKNYSRRLLLSTKYFFFELKNLIFFEMTKSFEFESMSFFEINFIIDMLGKLDKLGQGVFKKIMLSNYHQGTIDTIIVYFAKLI